MIFSIFEANRNVTGKFFLEWVSVRIA